MLRGQLASSPVKQSVLSLALLMAGSPAFGQVGKYFSVVDQDLTLKSMIVCPLVDNTKGIYAEPLSAELIKQAEATRRWNILPCPQDFQKITIEEYEEKPSLVVSLLSKAKAESLVVGRVSRGPSGTSLKLGLFLGKDGLPWSIENRLFGDLFELRDVKSQLETQFNRLVASLPFETMVLSRRGSLVTIDRGGNAGFKVGDEIELIQILSVKRHPKFKFVVEVEKSIMGKMKLQKVEETLSFASIVSERETGLIVAGYKGYRPGFQQYPEVPLTADGRLQQPVGERPDRDTALGSEAGEWLPKAEDNPGFGSLAFLFGFGSYTASNSLSSSGGVSSTKSLNPSLHLMGEAWITSNWIMRLNLLQNVAELTNELSGSSPSKLNLQSRELQLSGGYRVWFGEDLYSPAIEITFGMNQMSAMVDDSVPTAFTSARFDGLHIGFAGWAPVSAGTEKPILVGGRFNYVLSPSLSESPVTSGASSNPQVSQFSLMTQIPWKTRVRWIGELRFNQYGATFSGQGTRPESATSLSHSSTSLAAGLEFLF